MKYSEIVQLPNQIEFHTAIDPASAKEFNLFDLMDMIAMLEELPFPVLTINHGEPLSENNLFLTDLVINEVLRVIPNARIYVYTQAIDKDLFWLQNNNYFLDISEKAMVVPLEQKEKCNETL